MHRHAVPWLPAVVPGHVHEALIANRVIRDPFDGLHEVGAEWVDETDWEYSLEFDWQPSDHQPFRVLRFECLDTVCEVELNGQFLGHAANMFLPVEYDVTQLLNPGTNRLKVRFKSAVQEGIKLRRAYFEQEGLPWSTDWFDERAFVRKAQYMTGWDWGPRLVSCGIPGTVSLIEYESRISRVSFLQERRSDGHFEVWAEGLLTGSQIEQVNINGQHVRFGDRVVMPPELWWPAHEGPQTLHEVSVQAGNHRIEKRIGLRTIRLLRERDEQGQSFEFEVNGRVLWARGANWIPDDAFVGRVDVKGLADRIASYQSLGINMLRVWGGGFYESESFYDACDAHGILAWQDFPFACSYYPENQEFLDAVEAEAESQVYRLRDRTSLALWCGNNENEIMWVQRWGGDSAPAKYYGEDIYRHLLPRVVERLSPSTPYLRSSPIGIFEEGPMFGDSHYWDVWHGRGDWVHYQDSHTRFSSEYGFASSCSLAAWATCGGELDDPHGPVVRWHDKTKKGHEVFHGYVELHYPKSGSLEDWVYFSQLNQRDAMRHAIEHYRRSDYCRGSLIWQMNDCWPVQSWALEDYSRLLKPAGHELKRVYAQHLVSIVLLTDSAEVWLINDSQQTLNEQVSCRLVSTLTGEELLSVKFETLVGPGERKRIGAIPFGNLERSTTAVSARIDNQDATETWRWLQEPKDMQFLTPQITMEYARGKMALHVKGFAADLVVWDEDDPYRVISARTGLPGWCAQTIANGSAHFEMRAQPTGLRFRVLGMT
ncbi:MAG TPA: hypothetical protein PKA27_01335 [Fimbriimonadaceae bacterium]|nr:hypothetical protein [Fimbriimonadaceae bacterium]